MYHSQTKWNKEKQTEKHREREKQRIKQREKKIESREKYTKKQHLYKFQCKRTQISVFFFVFINFFIQLKTHAQHANSMDDSN